MSDKAVITVDPTSVALDLGDFVSTPVGAAIRFFLRWKDRNTPNLKAAQEEMFKDWVVQLNIAVRDQARHLEQQARDLEATRAKLESLVNDPALTRVCDNYGLEASREALDERRRMLAFAAAGSVNVDLEIAQIARVERTVRELDPADVKLLGQLARIEDPEPPSRPAGWTTGPMIVPIPGPILSFEEQVGRAAVERYKLAESRQPSTDTLIAAGCVQTFAVQSGEIVKNGLRVTHLGQWVLKVLDPYLRASAS